VQSIDILIYDKNKHDGYLVSVVFKKEDGSQSVFNAYKTVGEQPLVVTEIWIGEKSVD